MHAWNLEFIKLEEKPKLSSSRLRPNIMEEVQLHLFLRKQRKKLAKKRNSKAGVGLTALSGVIVLLIELLV